MIIDTQDLLSAFEPPTFRHNGQTVVGRFLSITEFLRFAERAEQLAGTNDEARRRGYVRDFCYALFPRRWWERLLGTLLSALLRELLRRPPHPAVVVLELPFAAQQRVLEELFQGQAAAFAPAKRPATTPAEPMESATDAT